MVPNPLGLATSERSEALARPERWCVLSVAIA
jgi:hypothetical protein